MVVLRPDFVKEEHLIFLDNLQESGDTNMVAASDYIYAAYQDLTKQQARSIAAYWMSTFTDRHPE